MIWNNPSDFCSSFRRFTSHLALALVALMAIGATEAKADVLYTYTASPSGDVAGTIFTIDSTSFLSYSSTPIVPTTATHLFVLGMDKGPLTVAFLSPTLITLESPTATTGVWGAGPYNLAVDGLYTDALGDKLSVTGSPSAAPEPGSLVLGMTGMAAGLIVWLRKRPTVAVLR